MPKETLGHRLMKQRKEDDRRTNLLAEKSGFVVERGGRGR